MPNVAPDTAATFCATLVDEWCRHGIVDAVVCPGSRSTPMALALARHETMRVSVRLDERGAGFFAVGLALGSGRPTVVLTTSGTAAAELHAAVVEAHHAHVPLIVCTADRPPELRDVGAPQTIDQTQLFGRAVRWFADLGVPDEAARAAWRSFASRAVGEAAGGPRGAGPVHLNLPFREPLIGTAGELPPARSPEAPWHVLDRGTVEHVGEARHHLTPGSRGIIVAGAGAGDPKTVAALAAELGWPVLADPRSGCRVAGDHVVGAADALLRDEGLAAEMVPDVVLRIGDPWASKVLAGWLTRTAGEGAVHIAVDPVWAWKDPGREVSVLAGAISAVGDGQPAVSGLWLQRWAAAEAAAQQAIDGVLARHAEATEPGIARALYGESPSHGCIVTSSSMPVRDMEWFARPRPKPPRVLSNRGANGIDGVVSTTLGVAASGAAGSVFGLVGDLAVLHDASALVRPAGGGPPMPAVIVVLDNDGGGIFNFLPQATDLVEAEFEQLFGTPQLPAVADLLRGCGYAVTEVAESAAFLPALAGAAGAASAAGLPAFVVVDTDRQANVALHGEIDVAVRQALADGLSSGRRGRQDP